MNFDEMLDDLKVNIEYYSENIESLGVNCLFVDQENRRNDIYKGYNLNCDVSLIDGAIKGTLKTISERIKVSSIKEYDFEYTQDSTIQYLKKEDVVFSDEIIKKISVNLDGTDTLSDTTKLERLDFIVIQLSSPDENVKDLYMFKKYIRPSTAFNGAVKIIFEGKQPKVFNKKIVTIGDNVDAILYDDKYFILNRNGFNSIFNYKEGFKKIIDEGYKMIEEANVFTDAEGFVEDCKSHGLYLPRLAKAVATGCFIKIKENANKIENVKKEWGLNLRVENDKIIYGGKEDIPEILNLLLEHYVISALSDSKMLAKAIEQYKMKV